MYLIPTFYFYGMIIFNRTMDASRENHIIISNGMARAR